MTDTGKDAGTIQLLLDRLNNERLPQGVKLKAKVDRGEVLDDYDTQVMKKVFEDSSAIQSLVARHPEYKPLVAKVSNLYSEISRKALENQKKASGEQL